MQPWNNRVLRWNEKGSWIPQNTLKSFNLKHLHDSPLQDTTPAMALTRMAPLSLKFGYALVAPPSLATLDTTVCQDIRNKAILNTAGCHIDFLPLQALCRNTFDLDDSNFRELEHIILTRSNKGRKSSWFEPSGEFIELNLLLVCNTDRRVHCLLAALDTTVR